MYFIPSSNPPAFRECQRCCRFYQVEAIHVSPEIKGNTTTSKKRDENLCIVCLEAKRRGFHRFWCQGCDTEVKGSYGEVKNLLNVYGKSFCENCRIGFYGTYSPENAALNAVLDTLSEKRRIRSSVVRFSYNDDIFYEEELKYIKLVRRISKNQFKKHKHRLNPKGFSLGPSGKNGAYHLDHIVPVSVCWEYYVPAEAAASVSNLQVIPWFVNISRGNYFSLDHLVGWPLRSKIKKMSPRSP